MAVTPIDLQTLYMQMPLQGKEQANARHSVILAQEAQAQKIAKDLDAKGHSVTKLAESDEENLAVKKDHKEKSPEPQTAGNQKKSQEEEETEEEKDSEFQDPDLGRHIDISG